MTQTTDTTPAAERASTRMAQLVFGPPVAVLLLRFLLNTLAERLPSVQPLSAVQVLGDGSMALDEATGSLVWQATMPLLLALAIAAGLLLALWLAVRVWGWRRVAPKLLALWLAACVLAAAGLALRYLNHAALQAQPEAAATVVEARPYPSSERGPGGAMTVLTLAGDAAAPRRVLLEGADPRALSPGHPLRLQLAQGRFWGEYVTGSDAPPAPLVDESPTAPAAP